MATERKVIDFIGWAKPAAIFSIGCSARPGKGNS